MSPGPHPAASRTTYRTLVPRSLAATRTPTLLPDIAEYSPNPSETRTPSPNLPSPTRRTLRSVSVASFLSDGTIEIEGFGFDTISEFGDDGSAFGDSIYDGSVYDGQEGDVDISRRAEKILANAKRKLDLCGQNISRARSSLILSPSATPTSLVEHLDAVGPTVRRAESAGGSRAPRWKYNNRSENEDRGPAHLRTASESALQSARALGAGGPLSDLRGLSNVVEESQEPDKPQERGVGRSNSTQQMRALRDQMKDLRGKITSLQEQTKTDSLKRRQSGSSLRSGETTPQWSPTAPTLEEIRESRVLSIQAPIEQEWEKMAAAVQRASSQYSVESDRSGTPTGPRREDVNSPTFDRHQYRSDVFSYDNYLYGNTLFQGMRPTSISSDETASTATATRPPPRKLERKSSFVSISSYATADENLTRSASASPNVDGQKVVTSLQASALQPPPTVQYIPGEWGSPRDDGYHSAPHTPRVEKEAPRPPVDDPPTAPADSWYRNSVDTIKTRSMVFDDDGADNSGGGVPLAIAGSATDSETMVLGGLGVGGKDEIELKIGRSDRILIEGVIEALGRVCCAMETEGERSRNELRARLQEAMNILDGNNGEVF